MESMRYDSDTCAVELSVRALCQYAMKSGNLGEGAVGASEAMTDGAAVHRRLQEQAGGFYRAEVSLRNTTLYEGIYFSVGGRADGVIRHADGIEVDEIKCVRGYDFFAPPKEIFVAQMKCYAYFLAVQDELSEIRGRLTYYDTDTKKTRYFRYRFSTDELRRFYVELLKKAEPWARLLLRREIESLPRTASLPFPYARLREGQEIMIRRVHSAIKKGKRIFVQAPTGTGKTISALYGAVRALGERQVDKIFYLTAKTSTGREAYRAAARLFESGADLRTVVITAKQQACLCAAAVWGEERGNPCNAKDCPFAKGYYDRVDRALEELLSSGNGYPRQRVAEVAKKHTVCPYELSLDLSELCDIVICDYNYAFDPAVYFRRYFAADASSGRYAFLIDEAHNLADRAREMYSAVLRASELERMAERLEQNGIELCRAVEALGMAVRRLRALCRHDMTVDAEGREQGFFMSRTPMENLNREVESLQRSCEGWLKKNREHALYGAVDGLCGRARKYLCVNEYFGDGFLCYVEVSGGDVTVKTYCLNPSPVMDSLLGRASAAVLFSATLTPPEYFCDVLGGARSASSVSLPSPFDPERLCVAIADYISVRAEDRAKNYARYASIIAATVSARAGNYIAYFPSYACLEGVRRVFARKYPRVELVVQEAGMGAKEREAFLNAFRDDEGRLRVGFCVLGGVFSEGVDLPGSRLIGSVIFGVGLPSLSNERNMIREYFDDEENRGYDYAYTYPGMNAVLQAAGRVIRRHADRGVVVLADDRYATLKYRALLPAHWQGAQYAGNAKSLAEIMRRFWENSEEIR